MSGTIEVIVQARMGSTRLPGKVMMDLCGKPVLWHVLERIKQCELISDFAVATTTLPQDDAISDFLSGIGVKCFRGDEKDVLSRFYHAALVYPADAIVRVTADCPLIDPNIIDRVIGRFLSSPCGYASNTGEKRTFPRGLDCEIFTFSLLELAFHEADEDYEREHVTPFMYLKQKSIVTLENKYNYSDMRWTLDTTEDFQLIREIYRHFYRGRHDFYMQDVYSFLKQNPHLLELNRNVIQKELISN